MFRRDHKRINRRALLGWATAASLATVAHTTFTAAEDDEYPGNGEPPLLVTTSWLAARLDTDPQMLIVDLQGLRKYRDRHIHGAVHAWWQDTMELNNSVYGTVLMEVDNQQQRLDYLRKLGIGPGTHVVAYDGGQGRWAARLVWFLRFLGHEQASMLEGGLAAWESLQLPVESGENKPKERSEVVVAPQPDFYLVTPQLLTRLEEPSSRLIDCRSADERQDTVNNTLPPGQIPGSIWYAWSDALSGSDGLLLPPDNLQQRFDSLGVVKEQQIFIYARYGVEAAHTWLVMKLLGFPAVTIYDRGWAGWITQADLPIQAL